MLLLLFKRCGLLILMRTHAFCMLQAALLPVSCPDTAAVPCYCRVLVPSAYPASGLACVARLEVRGGLILVAVLQEGRQRCCCRAAVDKARGGCWSLPLAALNVASI